MKRLPDAGGLRELVRMLREVGAIDQQLVELHTTRLPRISARDQRRTCATLRGLRRAIRATDAAIRKLERVLKECR